MADQKTSFTIELPSNIPQKEIWELEEHLKHVKGLEVHLREPKDIATTTILVLNIITSVGGTVTTIYGVSKIFYDFLHKKDKEQADKEVKKKVIIYKKEGSLELYNLSLEEIERILKDQ